MLKFISESSILLLIILLVAYWGKILKVIEDVILHPDNRVLLIFSIVLIFRVFSFVVILYQDYIQRNVCNKT